MLRESINYCRLPLINNVGNTQVTCCPGYLKQGVASHLQQLVTLGCYSRQCTVHSRPMLLFVVDQLKIKDVFGDDVIVGLVDLNSEKLNGTRNDLHSAPDRDVFKG